MKSENTLCGELQVIINYVSVIKMRVIGPRNSVSCHVADKSSLGLRCGNGGRLGFAILTAFVLTILDFNTLGAHKMDSIFSREMCWKAGRIGVQQLAMGKVLTTS